MEIRIKKEYIEAVLISACALSGLLFLYLLLEVLSKNGTFGYIVFGTFFTTLIWNISHWSSKNAEYKDAESYAQKYLDDEVKKNPDLFDQLTYMKVQDEFNRRSVSMVGWDVYKFKIEWPFKTKQKTK